MGSYRRSYIRKHGEPPDGFHIHHLCRNRACVKPEHLIAVSPEDHSKIHSAETFCVTVLRRIEQEPDPEVIAWMDQVIDPWLEESKNDG